MEVATRQPSLQELAQHLHQFLQQSLPLEAKPVDLQVQCIIKQGTLMALIQHSADVAMPAVKTLFEQLEPALLQVAPKFVSPMLDLELPNCNQVKLYLRVLGQQQPYACHEFAYEIASNPDLAADSSLAETSFDHFAATDSNTETSVKASYDAMTASSALVVAAPTIASEAPDDLLKPVAAPQRRLLWLGAAVGVSLVSFGAGMLIITYPCVLGRCEPIQTAQAISRQSARSLTQAQSNEELLRVRQQLTETNRLLVNVPPWSAKHAQAQSLLHTTQAQTLQVERVLVAEGKAGAALQKGQLTPQAETSWQAVRLLWQTAIDQLSTIPIDSPLYSLAQIRLRAYRQNLTGVDRLLQAEQVAQQQLRAAKSAAQKAEARQGIAQSLANWQVVQATWQVAVNRLQQVSSTTTAFATAQAMLGRYNPKLAEVRDRVTREQTAQTSYTQATQLAQTATIYEQQNQWSMAVITRRKALKFVRQVAKDTPFFDQAQALAAPYTQALAAAEAQLRSAILLQKAQNDLDRVCNGNPKTCSFLVTKAVIRVQFTPAYEQTMQTVFAARQAGNQSVVGNAINHINQLRSALQAIANNSGTPVETYSANGREIVWGFNPGG